MCLCLGEILRFFVKRFRVPSETYSRVTREQRFLSDIWMNMMEDAEMLRRRKQIEKMREKGNMQRIIGNLHSTDNFIINTSLYILGQCSMDEECAKSAIINNFLNSLEQLFERFPTDNKIIENIFRILGNICDHGDEWANGIVEENPDIVKYIVEQLRRAINDGISADSISKAALIKVIRLSRQLVTRETTPYLLEYKVLELVGCLLIQLAKHWECCSAKEELVANIIEVIHEFSRFASSTTIIQMIDTEMGDILPYMTAVLVVSPKQIVNILVNHINQLPPPVFHAACMHTLEKLGMQLLLLDYSNINEYSLDVIQSACLLLKETSRSPMTFSCVEALVHVLESLKEPSDVQLDCCLLIVRTLTVCRGDLLKTSQAMRAVTNKLQWVLSDKRDVFSLNEMKMAKRSRRARPFRGVNIPQCSLWSNSPTIPPCWLPKDGPTFDNRLENRPGSSKDKASSLESSFFQMTANSSDEPMAVAGKGIRRFLERKKPTEDMKRMLVDDIQKLIVAFLDNNQHLYFESEEILALLMNCEFHYNKAIQAVLDLSLRPSFFMKVMKSTLVEKVYALGQLNQRNSCIKCQESRRLGLIAFDMLTYRAISPPGRVRVKHSMNSGTTATKRQLALSIPYFIRELPLEVIIEFRSTEILMDILGNGLEYRQRAISAICVLISPWLDFPISTDSTPSTPLDLVTFKLDDGSEVRANRDLLMKKSDYFASLLGGYFKESAQNEVALSDIQQDSLLFVLDLIVPNGIQRLTHKDISLAVLLDAIVLCDRFLLKEDLVSLSILHKTAAAIYLWSAQSDGCSVQQETVTFTNVHSFRVATFDLLFELGFGGELVGDLRLVVDKIFTPRESTGFSQDYRML